MFLQKPPPKIDYSKYVESNFLDFLERIEILETSHMKINSLLEVDNLKWNNEVSDIKKDIRIIRENLEQMKNHVLSLKKDFIDLVNEFRLSALSEEYKRVQDKIESWELDKFITIDEFNRMIKQQL